LRFCAAIVWSETWLVAGFDSPMPTVFVVAATPKMADKPTTTEATNT
jgi:hypothetical protein